MMAKKSKTRQRSRRGAGSVIEVATRTLGTRYAIVHSYVDLDGKRHRPQLVFENRSQAENASAVLKTQSAGRGRLAGNGATATLDVVSHQFMAQANVERSTAWSREMSFRKHILPYIGRHRMLEMTPDLIERWKNLLKDTGVGHGAARMAWKNLSVCLQYAVKLRYIQTHPMHGLTAPANRAKEIVPFTSLELERIFAACEGTRWREVLELNYLLALRQGEQLGLKWEDLDFAEQTLRIRRQSVEEDGVQVIKEKTKTRSGMRTLKLGEVVLAKFEARRLKAENEGLWPVGYTGEIRPRPKQMLVNGTLRDTIDCEWIFPKTRGTRMPLSYRVLRRFWVNLLKELGIPHRGVHHFRHTAATEMILANENLIDIAGAMGHAKPTTPLMLYGHVVKKHQGSALASVGRTMGEKKPG